MGKKSPSALRAILTYLSDTRVCLALVVVYNCASVCTLSRGRLRRDPTTLTDDPLLRNDDLYTICIH